MKKILFLLFCIVALNLNAASDSTQLEIHIIDYSLSWTSSTHYYFDDELRVEEVDNINKKKVDVLVHRQLLGKEKAALKQYLDIFLTIDLQEKYVSAQPGDRNQKRINIKSGDKSKSLFISNTYQQDIAGFISFVNNFIPDQRKMKEFVDPNKPVTKK